MNNIEKYTHLIKSKARDLGFYSCGISEAGFLEEEVASLEQYLNNGSHGKMAYMANHFDKRLDPRLLVDGAKTVVSLLYNYFPEKSQNNNSYKISKYAYGEDYHFIIKDKLKILFDFISEEIGEVNGRYFVDSAPVLDRAWAKKSGLGWIGKNTNLISPKSGSFFFISELIIDLELSSDNKIKDYCGTCTNCIDACPTGALDTPYKIDGLKCISYFTIELKDSIPIEMKGKFSNWIFGCDICQDVCPWNRFSISHNEESFLPHPDILSMNKNEWEELSKEKFSEIFRKSAVKRTKYDGLKRNIEFVKDS